MRTATTLSIVAVLGLAVACGGKSDRRINKHAHYQPLSVAEHLKEADRHEVVAHQNTALYQPAEGQGQPPQCADDSWAGTPTSGGEEIPLLRPCWSALNNPSSRHLAEAEENLIEARKHRTAAAGLLKTEKQACAGLSADAIDQSPFFFKSDVVSVEAIYEGKTIVGARVLFREVKNLTRDWMQRSAMCHQARAGVMGYTHTFMDYCPLMVRGAQIAVEQTSRGIEVSVRAKDAASRAAIWGRSRRLLDSKTPSTATR